MCLIKLFVARAKRVNNNNNNYLLFIVSVFLSLFCFPSCMVRVNKNVTICKKCAPLCTALLLFASDLCGKRRNMVLHRFLPNVPQFGFFFCLDLERATISPGVRLLHRKMALKEDGTLSQITAHFREKTPHFRDDGTLVRKTVHFSDCGALGTVAARPPKCSAHD